jgi:hypothetical protein
MTKKFEIQIIGEDIVLSKGTNKITHNLVAVKNALEESVKERVRLLEEELALLKDTKEVEVEEFDNKIHDLTNNIPKVPAIEDETDEEEEKEKAPVPSGFCQACSAMLISGGTSICMSCRNSVHLKCMDAGICTDCLAKA